MLGVCAVWALSGPDQNCGTGVVVTGLLQCWIVSGGLALAGTEIPKEEGLSLIHI